ncbi:hypothetical protein [Actinomadura montaniterrae]|uniref:ATP-binding protein n=1 Tax=Actinomadura montaniterrae TaxID=1803903 RepID=A0A6L3VL72_9ACTN|nr:hypothetical protein [Actinomadura montaniterrae]KAB2372050.1 hypothetical protein F9B16_30760 [Actinomadura montaniterrae]
MSEKAKRDFAEAATGAVADETEELVEQAEKTKKGKKGGDQDNETQAQKLLKIALERYRFGRDEVGKPFAVPLEGSGVVRYFDKGQGELLNELAREFYRAHGKPPATNSLNEARGVLAGIAMEVDPEPVALRVGRESGPSRGIVIDLGDADERAVIVRPGSWEIVDKSPILFRRTKATMPFPEPRKGGTFDGIGELLNVSQRDLDLLLAYVVVSFIPEIQHAVLYINGEQGTGKSDLTKMLVTLMDPTSVPLRKKPRDDKDWSSAANASWVVPLENMSKIPEWLSDDLCRAVSGDGVIERQLYTNDDIAIRAFKRVIVLNGIEVLGIRPDLADRMFMVTLAPIPPEERRSEAAIAEDFSALRGSVFGAILDCLGNVLEVMESGRHITKKAPRLADFAHALRAVDLVWGDTKTLQRFWNLQRQQARGIAEGDSLTVVLKMIVASHKGHWRGTPDQLLTEVQDTATRFGKSSGIPQSPHSLGHALTRLSPPLREAGWSVTRPRSNGVRYVDLRAPEEAPKEEEGKDRP